MIERATSPADLLNGLHDLALATCEQHPVDERLLRAIFAVAQGCGAFSGNEVQGAAPSSFLIRVVENPHLRLWLPRFLSETELLALGPILSTRAGAAPFATLEDDLLHALTRAQEDTTIGALRAIKDSLYLVATDDAKASIRFSWALVVHLLEVSETVLGLEMFLDNLADAGVHIPPDLGERLAKLGATWGVDAGSRNSQCR